MLLAALPAVALGQQGAGKKAGGGKKVEIDPWYRPEGSIVDKSRRYYLWYEGNVWHLRSWRRR